MPDVESLPQIAVKHPAAADNGDVFHPYARDERLARPWALPGTPGLMHRIGGLEKQDITGNVNYEPANHEHMVNLRAAEGGQHRQGHSACRRSTAPPSGKLLVISWGGTYGACATAVQAVRARGGSVAHAHLRYLNPVAGQPGRDHRPVREGARARAEPRANCGMLLRAEFLVDAIGLNKIQGKPFAVREVVEKIDVTY